MALTVYGGLLSPFVSITPDENGSLWNIYPAPTQKYPNAPSEFLFGVVDGINYLGTRVSVGQRVMFNSGDAMLVTQAEVKYYIVDENTLSFQENPDS